MKGNLSLVNSEWTGRRFRDLYGVDPVTLYPPVPGSVPARAVGGTRERLRLYRADSPG